LNPGHTSLFPTASSQETPFYGAIYLTFLRALALGIHLYSRNILVQLEGLSRLDESKFA